MSFQVNTKVHIKMLYWFLIQVTLIDFEGLPESNKISWEFEKLGWMEADTFESIVKQDCLFW